MAADKVQKLKEVLDWLEENSYIYHLKGKYYLSNQVNRDLNLQAEDLGLSNPIRINEVDEDLYKRYISEAGVPARIQRHDGTSYYANRYGNDAAKEFTRIIRSGYILDVIIESTKRYYKNGGGKAIGNYILEGVWQTGYDELIKNAQGPTDRLPGSTDHRRLL
jgi:hypothetical protein